MDFRGRVLHSCLESQGMQKCCPKISKYFGLSTILPKWTNTFFSGVKELVGISLDNHSLESYYSRLRLICPSWGHFRRGHFSAVLCPIVLRARFHSGEPDDRIFTLQPSEIPTKQLHFTDNHHKNRFSPLRTECASPEMKSGIW